MKKIVYEKREDGSLRLENPIIVDSENVPENLYLADEGITYYFHSPDSGIEEQPVPTLEEKNRADIDYIAIMTGVEL